MIGDNARVSCDHLVCASCAGPVAEGRCPSCRARRADVHSHGGHLNGQLVLVLTVLLALLAVLAVYGR